jgi:cell division septation protein DedD
MDLGLGEDELEQAKGERDTELTLSSGMQLAIVGGLILLCVLCFGFGYAMGHRSSSSTATSVLPSPAMQTKPGSGSSTAKPMAAGQAAVQAQAATTVDRAESQGAGGTQAAEGAASAADSETSTQLQVRPALQAQVRPALSTQTTVPQTAVAMQVQPALTQVSGWMVQIASVSRPEDAEVLVNALRRRGYAVAVRREVSDSLLHVQVGPYVNRNDANAMRKKLQNDGYNAIVEE